MAENILKTRIQLKYDTYENWQQSEVILKKGEIAIVEIPTETEGSQLTPPAIGIKVGDGTSAFSALGWIQAIAGDVATWAKATTKPVYTAQEISGLEEFVMGEINDTNTQYQIVTEDEGQTYKLQKKDVGEEDYSDVAGSTIDLKAIFTQLSELATQIEEIDVTTQITTEINKLNAEDAAVEHQFVTQVSESKGIISVERAALTKADIPAIDQTQVTGLSDALAAKQDTLEFITPYNSKTNKAATKSDIDTALQGLSGALKFKGTQESLPEDTSGYTDGDVIFVQNKEYVCESETWRELGDETSFAVKGSIKDTDIAADANIAQSKIADLTTTLAAKVDKTVADETYVAKDGTKHLMSDEQDTKLAGIETGAQVNKIESISVNGKDVTIDETKKATITIEIPSGKLASLDEVSEDELETTLAEKINGKVDTTDLADIAKSGDVKDLKQTDGTILVLDCGSSTTVI